MPERRVILLFPTTHAVMHASQMLEDLDIEHNIVPRPKGVDADCGIAIAIDPRNRGASLEALRAKGREPSRVMELDRP